MHFPNRASLRATIEKHFRRKHVPYSEDGFIEVLQLSTSSSMDVYWATIGLRDVGTVKCIPFLKEKLHYPKQDVKDCSILTIAHIAGAAESIRELITKVPLFSCPACCGPVRYCTGNS